ncbi:hypothetical protein Salat_0535800 [Sesamum alatum]|uniref:Uncharacterized protein n=1 Tax=Sesamum alatum TaxID=300844 RepID=A0AAE2CT84_9LAMI|nr:hypothetical protein Salat_0535800 [Sesamum alatum]
MYDPTPPFPDHTVGDWGGKNSATNDGRLAQTDESCSNEYSDQELVQFRPTHNQEFMESDDSGVCSPPLWKNSPSSQPLLSHHISSSLSPNSRLQAITRGQRELMEMVKDLPESSYELSLKDLVEHHRMELTQAPDHHQVERVVVENSNHQSLQRRGVVRVKSLESKKSDKNMMMRRSGSFENKGLFLNMVFPVSFNTKKKKSNCTSGKVSPKPEVVKSGGERDWWKKRFTGSSDSDSSRTSNNSASSGSTRSSGGSSSGRSYSTGGRKKNGCRTGCWPFISRRSRSVE